MSEKLQPGYESLRGELTPRPTTVRTPIRTDVEKWEDTLPPGVRYVFVPDGVPVSVIRVVDGVLVVVYTVPSRRAGGTWR